MVAIFPKGIFNWLPRIDQVNIDYANDPNSLAAEVISVESTLGVQPQQEKNLPTGGTETYATVDARISDTLAGSNKPVVELLGFGQNVASGQSVYNTFAPSFDPYSCFNGRDITIPASGWWLVTQHNVWSDPLVNIGFSNCLLQCNGNVIHGHCWRWDIPNYHLWPIQRGSQQAGFNEMVWQGLLHQGDHLSVYTTNGTTCNPHVITSYSMRASFVRTITGTFTSG
jgi:hypothetical protein